MTGDTGGITVEPDYDDDPDFYDHDPLDASWAFYPEPRDADLRAAWRSGRAHTKLMVRRALEST